MSEVHGQDERPTQYRVPCEECGKQMSDYKRMHSQLRGSHVRDLEGVQWDTENTQVQCNNCGAVRTVE